MGHHRRPPPPGWLGRLIHWWHHLGNGKTMDLQRKADEALTAAQQQRHDVNEAADFVDRAVRAFRTRPS